MEDKWFIYFEEGYLYLHRSWTGVPVYRVRFAKDEHGALVTEALWSVKFANANTDQASYHAELLDFLISNLLLNKGKPFPTPPELTGSPLGAYQHHIAGTGYPEVIVRL